jgi:type III secretion protein U
LREAIHLSMPLLLAVGGAVALVGVVQTRALFEPKRIAPDLQRLSPSSMLRSLISSQRLFAIVRAIATAGVAGYLAARRLGQHLPDLAHSTGRLDHAAQVSASIAGSVARDTILVVLGLAAVDWIVTQRAWISRLRMTKQEVQREHRESEGDPQLKSDRERAHQEMLASATIAAVKDATVVIINPTRLANALRYREEQDETPVLIARAEGELARRIVDTARAYGIPIVQDVSVARALSELSQGDCIPPALYEAVGIILRDIQDA